jgi:hypothetical protein
MNDKNGNYNLLEEQWIPVLWADGRPGRVGIIEALTQAGRIRQIAATNPMDRVAILRFLLALLYWCRGNPPADAHLDSTNSFPADWFKKLDDNRDCFNLLGEGKRFYQEKQDQSKNYRPIGDLLQEFPTETKIAHFRHVRDLKYGLCPACCAIGIIRFSAFANAYGGGRYTSSVNGPTPAYAIPQGSTLMKTILLNWQENTFLQRKPPWLCNQAPSEEELDIVTVFAWRSRRLWLDDCGNSDEHCSYCGQSARLIRRLEFTGNWKPPFRARGTHKKFWEQDPHLILEEVSGKKSKVDEDTDSIDNDHEIKAIGEAAAGKKKTVTTLGFPTPGSRVAAHARFWRRVHSAILYRSYSSSNRTMTLTISVDGPAANKGLYQDATEISLPAVSTIANAHTRDILNFLTSATDQLIYVLRQSTINPHRRHPNRKASLDAQLPLLETRLREDFYNWMKSQVSSTDDASPAVEFGRDQLIERLRPVVEAVVAATTPGSPLRRREAAQRARRELKLAMSDKKVTPTVAVDKPKHGQ